jgi:hypothetical protein
MQFQIQPVGAFRVAGKWYVSVNAVCDFLGLNLSYQRQILKKFRIYDNTTHVRYSIPAFGSRRVTWTCTEEWSIPIKKFHEWFSKITPEQVTFPDHYYFITDSLKSSRLMRVSEGESYAKL